MLGRGLYFAGFALVLAWFLFGGAQHFFAAEFFVAIVPAYVPHPREIVFVTGICDIAGALGLLWPRTRRIAGYALMLYCVCVLPVHIDMLIHADRFDISPAILWGRLLFQPILIWIIWVISNPQQARALPEASADA